MNDVDQPESVTSEPILLALIIRNKASEIAPPSYDERCLRPHQHLHPFAGHRNGLYEKTDWSTLTVVWMEVMSLHGGFLCVFMSFYVVFWPEDFFYSSVFPATKCCAVALLQL